MQITKKQSLNFKIFKCCLDLDKVEEFLNNCMRDKDKDYWFCETQQDETGILTYFKGIAYKSVEVADLEAGENIHQEEKVITECCLFITNNHILITGKAYKSALHVLGVKFEQKFAKMIVYQDILKELEAEAAEISSINLYNTELHDVTTLNIKGRLEDPFFISGTASGRIKNFKGRFQTCLGMSTISFDEKGKIAFNKIRGRCINTELIVEFLGKLERVEG